MSAVREYLTGINVPQNLQRMLAHMRAMEAELAEIKRTVKPPRQSIVDIWFHQLLAADNECMISLREASELSPFSVQTLKEHIDSDPAFAKMTKRQGRITLIHRRKFLEWLVGAPRS